MRKNKQYLSQVEKRLEVVLTEDSIELSKVEIHHQGKKTKKRRGGRIIFKKPFLRPVSSFLDLYERK